MNEAKEMHDELLNTLLPIIPRTAYQDSRRLSMLVWAITGLCLTHTVRLGAWAEVLSGHAQSAASVWITLLVTGWSPPHRNAASKQAVF